MTTNIHNAPVDMRYYASLTEDELRRREETTEAKAETLRGYHIPTWPYAR